MEFINYFVYDTKEQAHTDMMLIDAGEGLQGDNRTECVLLSDGNFGIIDNSITRKYIHKQSQPY